MIDHDIASSAYNQLLGARSLACGGDCCDLESMASLEALATLVTSCAEGVFLRVRSIVDILCQHIATGAIDQELRAHLMDFPLGLANYYRQMIYDRVHSNWFGL